MHKWVNIHPNKHNFTTTPSRRHDVLTSPRRRGDVEATLLHFAFTGAYIYVLQTLKKKVEGGLFVSSIVTLYLNLCTKYLGKLLSEKFHIAIYLLGLRSRSPH